MSTNPSTNAGPVVLSPSVSPEAIMRLASGFMAAKHLFAASQLGLFEALADSPAGLDALAARTGLSRRAARISADAMVAVGLLVRDGDLYRNSEVSATFLSGSTPADLRPFLRMWDRVSYPAWSGLAEALGDGPTHEIFELGADMQEVFSAGVESITAGPVAALADTVDFTRHQRLLDVGGGTGSWSMAAARRHPHLKATVFELPATAEIARKYIAAAGMGFQVGVVAGDATADALPGGHDVCLMANLIHYFSPEENQALLRRARDAFDVGSRLLLADFWTDPTHTEPVMAALMAGEFAVHLRHGDVYSVDEATDWLDATGWSFVEHRPLAGPFSLILAEAL